MQDHKQHAVHSDAVMERTLFRNLTGIVLAGTLFYFALVAINSVIDDVVESKYGWVAERFNLSISHIHTEWMRKGRPDAVNLTYYLSKNETTEIVVQVNSNGWPLNISSGERQLNCLNLWMLFAHEETHSQSIMDITSELEIKSDGSSCHYFHLADEGTPLIFSYFSENGNVDSL